MEFWKGNEALSMEEKLVISPNGPDDWGWGGAHYVLHCLCGFQPLSGMGFYGLWPTSSDL